MSNILRPSRNCAVNGRAASVYFGLKAQNTLRPRDRLRCRLLTTVYILLEHVLSKILRPATNGAVNGRAASVYFGLKGQNTLRPRDRLRLRFLTDVIY